MIFEKKSVWVFVDASPSLLISWWLPTYRLWHVSTRVYMDVKVLWWELLTAPLWHRIVFSWHGSRSQNPWALKADASTVPSRLNVFSRGKGRKCFYAFLMNGAWLTVFSPYAAVVGPRLQTQLNCASTRGLVVFSPHIFSIFYNKS